MTLDNLQVYSSMGWPLFPVSSLNKKPFAGSSGFKDATTDWQQVIAWHKAYPGCAWAVATSAEIGVADIDPRHNGDKALAKLIAQHGLLSTTPTVKTGGGGWHYWLRFPTGTGCRKLTDGIDLKAIGGYVVVPPSKINIPEHEGRAYVWEVRPWETTLAVAPAWLVEQGQKAKSETVDPWVVRPADDDLLTHPGSPEGQRRKTLVRLVGVHLARSDSESTVYALAESWAKRCTPPLDEWAKHVDGLIAKDEAKGIKMTTSSRPCRTSVSVEEDVSDTLQPANERTNSASADGSKLVSSQPEAERKAEDEASTPSSKLVSSQALGQEQEQERRDGGLSTEWPTLADKAYHGLFGEMLKAIEPETEGDPAGILLGWLTCFGNCVGRGAWYTVGPRLHHPALYVGIVGTSGGGKADCWGDAKWAFQAIEPEWCKACIASGVGSGEGLIERIADEQMLMDKDGVAKVIHGSPDKRCLVRLSELSRCFKVGRRENSTLSEYLREAWDGEPISVPNRKGNALASSDYSISLFGDITPGALRKLLATGTEAFDGWANRFLWAVVRSLKDIEDGGNTGVLKPYLERLVDVLTFAKQAGEMSRDDNAKAIWKSIYPSIKRSGDTVPHTDRARPYVVRLSMLYALADYSTVIRADHLQAALAVWDYCRASARLLFSEQGSIAAEPDPLWLQVLNAINDKPGISRKGLHEAFNNRLKAEALTEVLSYLERNGMAYKRKVQPQGGGHPAECWYPGTKPYGEGDGRVDDGEKDKVDNPPAVPPQEPASPSPAVCELTNYLPDERKAEACEQCELTNLLAQSKGELVSSQADTANKLLVETKRELVSSFAGSQENTAEASAETVETGERREVVNFIHEPCGSLGLSGKPSAPYWPVSTLNIRREGDELLCTPAYHADAPPEPLPERRPNESNNDYFLRCLDIDEARAEYIPA